MQITLQRRVHQGGRNVSEREPFDGNFLFLLHWPVSQRVKPVQSGQHQQHSRQDGLHDDVRRRREVWLSARHWAAEIKNETVFVNSSVHSKICLLISFSVAAFRHTPLF